MAKLDRAARQAARARRAPTNRERRHDGLGRHDGLRRARRAPAAHGVGRNGGRRRHGGRGRNRRARAEEAAHGRRPVEREARRVEQEEAGDRRARLAVQQVRPAHRTREPIACCPMSSTCRTTPSRPTLAAARPTEADGPFIPCRSVATALRNEARSKALSLWLYRTRSAERPPLKKTRGHETDRPGVAQCPTPHRAGGAIESIQSPL